MMLVPGADVDDLLASSSASAPALADRSLQFEASEKLPLTHQRRHLHVP